MSSVRCLRCHREIPFKKAFWCAKCKDGTYCSKECQKDDWKNHKPKCKTPAQRAEEKEQAVQLLRELRLSVDGPAARGSVTDLQAIQPLLIPEPDALSFTPAATKQRITGLKQLLAKGGKKEGWAAPFGGAETANDLLFKQLGGLFRDNNYAEICRIKDEFVAAAVECYSTTYDTRERRGRLLCVAFEIWHILGQSFRKTMQHAPAVIFFVRAYDAATTYFSSCSTPPGLKRSM